MGTGNIPLMSLDSVHSFGLLYLFCVPTSLSGGHYHIKQADLLFCHFDSTLSLLLELSYAWIFTGQALLGLELNISQ